MNPMDIVKKVGSTKGVMVIRKFAPEICTGIGIVSGAACTVFACKATLKVDEVLDKRDEDMDKIHKAENFGGKAYSQKDAVRDKTIVTVKTTKDILKLYAPAIGLGTLSVTSILGGYGILKKRNIVIAAAYSALNGKFKNYRKNVVDELGSIKDKQFLYGLDSKTITVTETDENGKSHKKKVETLVVGEHPVSPYAKFFDDASDRWVNDPMANLSFLTMQQNFFNDQLHIKGHVFLNEVYDSLGIPRTPEGAICGWVFNGEGDNFVDFGIYSIANQEKRDFVNGYESAIFLDFNVDGVIYDLI